MRPISSASQLRRDSKDSTTVSALTFPAAALVPLNRSFLYIKPHANTKALQAFIADYLTARHFQIVAQGVIPATELPACVDQQYAGVGKKALVLAPHECSLSSLSMMAFEHKFRISWSVAVKKKLVQNARDACDILGATEEELGRAWVACIQLNKMVKLGRDFYCGYIDTIPNTPAVFVINGYYMAMRAEYVTPSAAVYYYCVEWEHSHSSWKDFRKKVIGDGDPALAHPKSLRALIDTQWRQLDLGGPLNMIQNGIHASASAFEALVEHSVWLQCSAEEERLGEDLIRAGLTQEVLRDWMANVSVKGKPVFDHMDDKGNRDCVETAKQLLGGSVKCKYTPNCFTSVLCIPRIAYFMLHTVYALLYTYVTLLCLFCVPVAATAPTSVAPSLLASKKISPIDTTPSAGSVAFSSPDAQAQPPSALKLKISIPPTPLPTPVSVSSSTLMTVPSLKTSTKAKPKPKAPPPVLNRGISAAASTLMRGHSQETPPRRLVSLSPLGRCFVLCCAAVLCGTYLKRFSHHPHCPSPSV